MRSPTTLLVLLTLLFAALPAGASAQQEDDQAFLRVPVRCPQLRYHFLC